MSTLETNDKKQRSSFSLSLISRQPPPQHTPDVARTEAQKKKATKSKRGDETKWPVCHFTTISRKTLCHYKSQKQLFTGMSLRHPEGDGVTSEHDLCMNCFRREGKLTCEACGVL